MMSETITIPKAECDKLLSQAKVKAPRREGRFYNSQKGLQFRILDLKTKSPQAVMHKHEDKEPISNYSKSKSSLYQ